MGRGIWGCGAVQQAVLLVEVIGRGGACNRRHARGPRRWGGCCRGMDEDAVAAFRGTQPCGPMGGVVWGGQPPCVR